MMPGRILGTGIGRNSRGLASDRPGSTATFREPPTPLRMALRFEGYRVSMSKPRIAFTSTG